MKNLYRATRAIVIFAHIAATITVNSTAFAATSAHALPAPQISKALDALLLPIDKAVIKKFKLKKGEHGVFVLSVKPGGVADKQGIKPGDIISEIHGHKVHKPVDVDAAVERGLKAGNSNVAMDLYRGGATVEVTTVVTQEEYNEAISVTEVSTWESETTDSSFSYSEFVSEETSEIESSYESEETTVEEELKQDESANDAETAEEASEDSDTSDDAGDDSSDGD
ncbi:PDZ domain-containing protein [Rhizobium sp. P44RR-XXIV]|nr:PDZ domain-containing protein [Rhizobium sp. P44RR-XXIV]